MKKFGILLCLLLGFALYAPHSAAQTSPPPPDVRTTFLSESGASLEQLAGGGVGQGVILYYLAARGQNHPSLAVRLQKDAGATTATAQVFQASTGQQEIGVKRDGTKVILDLPLGPSVIMTSLDGWWLRDGHPSYNLDMQVKGQIYAMWGGGYDPVKGPSSWTALVKPGQPDASIQVRDPQHEGLPKWDLRQLLPDFGLDGYLRTNYMERKCNTALTINLGVSPLWPYVITGQGYEQFSGVLDPPIGVNWEQAKINYVAEFVTARNQNCSYTLYTLSGLKQGDSVNKTNFESPFAFYDLSGQGKGFPNMILRTQRAPANDPWSSVPIPGTKYAESPDRDSETIRYSWRNAVGDQLWDYKVETMGFQPYTSDTSLAGGTLHVDAPSYEEFPTWVTGKSWPIVTFVDTEGHSYLSSEGIYDYSPYELGLSYIFGLLNTPDPAAFTTLPRGLRGEYRYKTQGQPTLYFSPVDNRLHLLHAEGGLWSVAFKPNSADTNQLAIQVHNLDNGPYINSWTSAIIPPTTSTNAAPPSPIVQEQLYVLRDYILYAGSHGIELRHATVQPSTFTMLPPTDAASWEAERQRLAPYISQKRDPYNLASWLDAFPGESDNISLGRVSDVHTTATGFQFVMTLPSGFQAPPAGMIPLQGLGAGKYSVAYDGSFTIHPYVSPTITATLSMVPLTALKASSIQIALHNTSTSDVTLATLELWATSATGETTQIAELPFHAPAQGTTTVHAQWTPPDTGQWTLVPKVRYGDEGSSATTALAATHVAVGGKVEAAPTDILATSATNAQRPFLWEILGVLAVVSALFFWRQWQTQRNA